MSKMGLQEYAENRLAEELVYVVTGFVTIADAVSAVEDIESNFDAESYCPYYHEQDDVLSDYESDYGVDAEDITNGVEYAASDWQSAKTAYVYAVAYCAHESFFSAAKTELVEGLEEFESDVQSELKFDGELKVQLSTSCNHGWAAHDRELADGTMIFESKQLDGCNGMERKIGETWVSCCFDPTATEHEFNPDHNLYCIDCGQGELSGNHGMIPGPDGTPIKNGSE